MTAAAGGVLLGAVAGALAVLLVRRRSYRRAVRHRLRHLTDYAPLSGDPWDWDVDYAQLDRLTRPRTRTAVADPAWESWTVRRARDGTA